MPVLETLPPRVTDQVAHNRINHGHYLLITLSPAHAEAEVIGRDITRLDLTALEQALTAYAQTLAA